MSTSRAIRVSWRTPALKATSFLYYHQRCYKGVSLPNAEVREIAMKDLAPTAICSECQMKIRELGGRDGTDSG